MDFITSWSVPFLVITSIFVAVADVRKRFVGNSSVVVVFVTCIGINVQFGASDNITYFLLTYISLFIGLLFVYSLKVVGGGDIKLIMAYAVALPPSEIGFALILTAIAGGILALVYLFSHLAHCLYEYFFRESSKRAKPSLPYAVAICISFCFSIAKHAANGELS